MSVRLLLGVAFVANILVLEICTAHSCPAFEEWSTCAQLICTAQKCSEKDKPKPCPQIMEESCEEACVCQQNYLRNENGDCVPKDQCPPLTCGENEVLDNCSLACNSDYCPQSPDEEPVCTQSDPCVPACKCRFNYRRADNGTCIPTRDCPHSCPAFEEWSTCAQLICTAQKCSEKDKPKPCPQIMEESCEEACVCQQNYLRNENGDCVPKDQCPPLTCGENEVLDNCSLACNSDYCPQSPDEEPVCTQSDPCVPACKCRFNYRRADNGTCIPTRDCPHSCPAFEEWSTCAQLICTAQKCSEKDKPKPCPMIMEESCEEACVCQQNYLRNENGDCVPEDQCPPLTCGENEVLKNCSSTCNTDNCPRSADEKQVCTQSDPCVPACKCRFNYRRADNGTCIPTRDCPPLTHDVYQYVISYILLSVAIVAAAVCLWCWRKAATRGLTQIMRNFRESRV